MKTYKEYLREKADIQFNYNSMQKSIWWDLTKEAMKKFNIYFDMENYDAASGKYGDRKLYKTGDRTFIYQQAWSGGDWQEPTILFKCQLKEGYVEGMSVYGKSMGMFVYIPNVEEGNVNLVKDTKGEKLVPLDADDKSAKKINRNKCIQSLKLYLDNLK